jgi:hypothetical protein
VDVPKAAFAPFGSPLNSNVPTSMRTVVLVLLLGMLSTAVLGQETPRPSRPAFKGVELYSWRICMSCDWQFALLPGTNRLKTLAEIREPAKAISGVAELEQRLSRLAEGERVFWFHRSLAELSYPEPAIVAQVVSFSAQRNITVTVQR